MKGLKIVTESYPNQRAKADKTHRELSSKLQNSWIRIKGYPELKSRHWKEFKKSVSLKHYGTQVDREFPKIKFANPLVLKIWTKYDEQSLRESSVRQHTTRIYSKTAPFFHVNKASSRKNADQIRHSTN